MEEFAQSRGDDDLFDDEIVPIEPSAQPIPEVTAQMEQPPPVPITDSSQKLAAQSSNDRPAAAQNRGRGRGRGRGGQHRDASKQQQNSLGESKYAPKSGSAPTKPAAVQSAAAQSVQGEVDTAPPADSAATEAATAIPTGPANATPARPPAVKGDRLKTGGIQRPKLTEAELNAKLAAAKERSQNLAAAHARAQADADSFAERERVASEKRAKEIANRKAQEGERERNRERKLKGQGGREWDAQKNQADFATGRGGGKGGARRLWTGAEEQENDLSMYEWHEDRGRGRGRGRGGRGNRGRGRGDSAGGAGYSRPARDNLPSAQPDLSAETEFPALPSGPGKNPDKKPEPLRKTSEAFDSPAGGSWAEQVESSEAARS